MDKIICVGKNYLLHAQEMNEALPEKPLLFFKPPSCLLEPKDNAQVVLPWKRGTIHHEVEIAFKLYKKNIIGIGLGLDMTLRNVQKELKKNAHPWEVSKCFKNSALVTKFLPIKDFKNWEETPFELIINGQTRQKGIFQDSLFKANEIIHYADACFPLCDSDIILTGTPEGVGEVKPDDQVEMKWGPIEKRFKFV